MKSQSLSDDERNYFAGGLFNGLWKRTQIAAANWKMNLDLARSPVALIDDILAGDAVMGRGARSPVLPFHFPYLLAITGEIDRPGRLVCGGPGLRFPQKRRIHG